MKRKTILILTILTCCVFMACKSGAKSSTNMDNQKETMLNIETTMGNIKIKLYNETPLHRDNFIKLAKEGTYEGTLFHRVRKDYSTPALCRETKNDANSKQRVYRAIGYTSPAE